MACCRNKTSHGIHAPAGHKIENRSPKDGLRRHASWPFTLSFAAFHDAKDGLSSYGRAPFSMRKGRYYHPFGRLSALKRRPFARFSAAKYCTFGSAYDISTSFNALYVCTLIRAIFPPTGFIFQNIAVQKAQPESACHRLATYRSITSEITQTFKRQQGRKMLKNRQPSIFS